MLLLLPPPPLLLLLLLLPVLPLPSLLFPALLLRPPGRAGGAVRAACSWLREVEAKSGERSRANSSSAAASESAG